MQKFGLYRSDKSNLNAIELEIIREKSTALGRAGKKLRVSLEQYHKRQTSSNTLSEQELLNSISLAAWELILQREFAGFTSGNLEWIQRYYKIPSKALTLIGTR
jgi:hypothetical protein